MIDSSQIPQDLWVFGYGSVIWKHHDVPHTESRTVFVRGFKRRFWQGSKDHRGTEQLPGRVVAIFSQDDFKRMHVQDADAAQIAGAPDPWAVYGKAFRVTPHFRQEVIDTLHLRETDYVPLFVKLYQRASDGTETLFQQQALTFVAPIDNNSFLGFSPHANIATHIASAVGDAGTNAEYARNLHAALVDMGHPDSHVQSIVSLLHSTS